MKITRKFRPAGLFLLTLLAAPLLVGGCGFQPVYGTLGRSDEAIAAEQQFARVRVAPITERDGQMLRNHLIDRIYVAGTPRKPDYELQIILRSREAAIDIDRDDTVTRSQLLMNAQAKLVETATGKTVWTADSRAITNYNELVSPFSTLVSERAAHEQALRQIGDDLVIRLGAYFTTLHKETAAKPAE